MHSSSNKPPPCEFEIGAPHSWCSVFNGHRCVGHLVSRGCQGIEAYDLADRSMGVFATQAQAVAELRARAP